MKTTVDIPGPLLDEARRTADREGTTLKALVEAGLRRVLVERRGKAVSFRLRDASFLGDGLQPGVTTGSWEAIRDAIYEGRGA
jgi:hypothetical protein